MDVPQSKPFNADQSEILDENSQDKIQQPELPNPSVEVATKITNLNDDCLVEIFGYLDPENLFNVAISNEWLRPAAAVVYERKFRLKNITGDIIISRFHRDFYGLKILGSNVFVHGLKSCLQYLRCFGPSIVKLYIDCCDGATSKQCEYLFHYINTYCVENLVEFSFCERSNLFIEQLTGPFMKVRKIDTYSNYWDEQSSFLSLSILKLLRERCNDVLFPNLQQLGVSNFNDSWNWNWELKNFEFILGRKTSLNTLLDIIKDISSITKLEVKTFHTIAVSVNRSEIERTIREHPSLEELHLQGYQFRTEDALTLIRQLESLKKFVFRAEDSSDYTELEAQLRSEWRLTEHYMPYRWIEANKRVAKDKN